ncbi:hypothetical protein IID19_04105 [Patescibacteria group bacterium]|nr:hypothetical protein [Patescibacteria group bacterium]
MAVLIQPTFKNIILTASGGPFKDLPKDKFSKVTVAQALNHPTWKMGKKITIDSATLANKGLEVIEAIYLFDIHPSRVKVVIHPQSIIHSLLEYIDSSIIAQMSKPDMRLPITYALFWPNRVESSFGELNLTKISELTFAEPDLKKFRMLKIAFEVAESGGTSSAIYNAANEIAVAAFLNDKISFDKIPDVVNFTLDKMSTVAQPDLEHILDADNRARELAKKYIESRMINP